MANGQPAIVVENTFKEGLKTEFTGLNFPENACTETENCVFLHTGKVLRRPGIDYEQNFAINTVDRTGKAINSYKWNNAGGDGSTQIVVLQIGGILYLYKASSATTAAPLSTTLVNTADLTTGGGFDTAQECQFADGNGYLFVFHPTIDPVYLTFNPGTNAISINSISVQIRDFVGLPDFLMDTQRPSSLSNEHLYNLYNQGWSNRDAWSTSSSTSFAMNTGSGINLTVDSGLTAAPGDAYSGTWTPSSPSAAGGSFAGTVSAYSGTSMTITITSFTGTAGALTVHESLAKVNQGLIDTWHTATGTYPSNADVWWYYKNASGVFDPSTTFANVPQANAPAPKGSFITSAFNINRSAVSGIASLTTVSTSVRPRVGAFFQGRVWYAGVDASFGATGDVPFSTWTENIYFSQIIERTDQFGKCYQVNDPTSDQLFDLLGTDGGVVTIQGSGPVYRLFPVQNGMLVFAGNGIWFLTGSQGIGFAANDYTITKISGVRSLSPTSYVDVQGWPLFWNEEGIYKVTPGQQGGLAVDLMTYATIASFYDNIPIPSRKYARGVYDPINYIVQWLYRTQQETSVTDRYQFDGVLNFHAGTQAFYPYTISSAISGSPYVNGINYVVGVGGSTTPDPIIKFVTSVADGGSYDFTFSEERDTTNWTDFVSSGFTSVSETGLDIPGLTYSSFFITGYKLHGSAIRKFQPEYIMVFSGDAIPTQYRIQGLWNYAANRNSGKFSAKQLVINNPGNFVDMFRRHRMRGMGIALQFKIESVDTQPFDIIGWSVWETQGAI